MHFISLGLGLGSSIGGEESICVLGWLTDRNCGKIQQLASHFGPCPAAAVGGKAGGLEVRLHTCPDILGFALGPPLVGVQPQHWIWHSALLGQYK